MAAGFAGDALEPRERLRELGFDDPPFGFDAGVIGGCLGERQLGRAGGALRVLRARSKLGAA